MMKEIINRYELTVLLSAIIRAMQSRIGDQTQGQGIMFVYELGSDVAAGFNRVFEDFIEDESILFSILSFDNNSAKPWHALEFDANHILCGYHWKGTTLVADNNPAWIEFVVEMLLYDDILNATGLEVMCMNVTNPDDIQNYDPTFDPSETMDVARTVRLHCQRIRELSQTVRPTDVWSYMNANNQLLN